MTSYIPEEEFEQDKGVMEIVTLADVRAEYAAVLARLQLASVLPGFFDISEYIGYSSFPTLTGQVVCRWKPKS